MVFGQYDKKSTYEPLLMHPVWAQAFAWIQEHGKALPEGEHEITGLPAGRQGRDIYANIQALDTLPTSEGVFEVHREYIDIHYCLEGGEIIGYAPTQALEEKTVYDEEKDYQLFTPSNKYSSCFMQPNDFAIFFPGELHMPKIQDGINSSIKKVVIKIKKNLLV